MRRIRLGAARQHVDAVLIYEVFANSERSSNPLAVTKIALVGFFLAPSENIVAMQMTKWFDTNYHYIVPEFTPEAGAGAR